MILLLLSLVINISGEIKTFHEYRIHKRTYIECDSLINKLDLSSHWDNKRQIMTLQKERIVYLIPDNPFIKIDRNIQQTEYAPIRNKGKLLIPESTLPVLLSNLLNMKATYREGNLEIGTRMNVYNASIEGDLSITKYTIECSSALNYFFNKNNGEWVLTLFNPIYRREIFPEEGMGLIENISIEEGDGFIKFRFRTRDDLPMDIIRKGKMLQIKVQKFEKRSIQTIVIDAGHGGKDPGATFENTYEKNIVLQLSKLLASKLTEEGFNIIMTRVDDTFIPLKERTEIADKERADFFVSIHCNAAPNKRNMHGAETYFLSAAKSDWARTVEATENSAVRYETEENNGVTELDYILNDLAQTQFLEESQQAAIYIQESLIHNCKLFNRGVKQANFYVLRLNYMPAVLVEAAFLTNAYDRSKLKDENFLKNVADAIAEGIIQYARTN